MAFRVGFLALGGAIVAAAGLVALFHTERTPEPAGSSGAATSPPAAQSHPTVVEAPAIQGPKPPSEGSGSDDATAIVWRVPSGWRSVPNPNGMRLATYDVADSASGEHAEVSVSRAGGSTDANIQRWRGQFSDADQARRAEKTVRGLPVTLVEIRGTYSAAGMMPGAPAATPHPGWALVAAIVQTGGSSYFFKMIGPAQTVQAARASFDTLVDSLAPR